MEIELFVFITLAFSEVLCQKEPTDLKLVNFQKEFKRGESTEIGIVAKGVPGLGRLYYKWEIFEPPNGNPVKTSSSNTIGINGYEYRTKRVFTTKYAVVVRVSHYSDISNAALLNENFRFIPHEMRIEIVGGSRKTHLVGFNLEMDAKTLSRDLSYPPNENAFEGNTVSWSSEPEIKNFKLPFTLYFVIPYKFLKSTGTYTFSVTVTRTKIRSWTDRQSARQVVQIIAAGSTPEINIKCIRNCINPHFLEPTAFAVECCKNCANVTYKWTIEPPIDSRKIEYVDQNKVIVRENSYKAGDKFTVKVEFSGAYSSTSLQFMSGIKKGNCDINPKVGVSGITLFEVSCKGFSSPNGALVYMIYQKSKQSGAEGVLLNEGNYDAKSNVYLTEDSSAVIIVKVIDSLHLEEEIQLSAQVKPFTPQGSMSKPEALKTLVLSQDSASVTYFSEDGFSNKVVQMVSFLLDAIKECKELDNSTVKDLHNHMAESLTKAELLRFESSAQFLSILLKLQKFQFKTDTSTGRLVAKSMTLAANSIYKMHAHTKGYDIPQYLLNQFFATNLRLASEQLKKVEELKSSLIKPTPPQEYDSYDEYVSEKLQITDDLREQVTSVLVSLQTNAITTIYKNIPDEKEMYFDLEKIYFTSRRVYLASLIVNQTISLSNVTKSAVFLPKALIEELQKKRNYIDYQLGLFKENPFWWHKNSSTFNTEFILFDFFDRGYKIKTLKNPFYVHLQTANVPTGKLEGTLEKENIGAHRIEVEPGTFLIATFKPSDETYKVTTSRGFCQAEDFSKGIEIKKGTNDSQRTLTARPVEDANVIYVCIMKSGSKLNYTGNFATFSCIYWDLKAEKWKSDGCEVQNAALQNNSLMVCKCSHFSLFVGKIFVAPNSFNLDLTVDFTIAFVKNELMVIIIVILLLLWIICLILAHLRDKAMRKKNVVLKLDDSVPGDDFIYLIVVFTGTFFDAGTTADVAFQLIGDRAKSRVHLIRCQNVTLLKRNAQDWFVIHTPFYLGNLRKIRIWHNTRGKKPHWYCLRFIVQDLKKGEQYCFSVNKWLSLIWGNGKIYREIRVDESNMKGRKVLFMTQVENEMRDKHLWLSVVVRDTQSNFSSKERISCAFCLVFLSMLASAMFYGIPRGDPQDSIDEVSTYQITFYHVILVLESWLVATPVGIFIVWLFKNSAPRSQKKQP